MRTPIALLGAFLVLLVACGDGSPPDAAVAEEPLAQGGLAVRVVGIVSDGALCPGGERPCLPLDGAVEPDEVDRIVVTGRLVDGVLVVDTHEQPVGRERLQADRCGPEVTPADVDFVSTGLAAYLESIPDEFATTWISASGTLHLGVVGDAGPHLVALMDRGLSDHVCVVGAFERSQQELDRVATEARQLVIDLQAEGGPAFFAGFGDVFAGAAVLEVERVDVELADLVRARFGELVELRAPITVLDGTFADLDAALAEVEPDDDVRLEVTCGDVRFDRLPPDPADLPPLDEDAQGALDRAATGRAAQEFAFLADAVWRIAERSDERLVLLGVPVDDGDGFVTASFQRVDGTWEIDGFGGCRVQVSAVGLGPAEVELDPSRPPDPGSTELPVLIREQACASGQAPIGREIVPVVTETDRTVEIVVLVAPVSGGAECPGNPWHPITVELESPLGDRTVLDGSTQPPVERPWPPVNPELG
ncbi:MAG: hypothetical protein AAFZ07_21530 [Actinomycetota bacterium]